MTDQTRIIANRAFPNDERQEMLKAIQDLQREVKSLSATVSEKIGSRRSMSEYEKIVEDAFKKHDKKNESVEERANRILQEFKDTREEDRRNVAAQIQASFKVFGEKMKHPVGSGSSALLSGLGSAAGHGSSKLLPEERIAARNREYTGKALKGLGKLVAPKREDPTHDTGQVNPNTPDSPQYPSRTSEQISVLRGMLKKYKNSDGDNSKTLESMISSLEKQDKLEKINGRKLKTVKELAAEKEQAQYDKENDEKKQILAESYAKVKVMKEKYGVKNFVNSIASDTLTGLGNAAERGKSGMLPEERIAKANRERTDKALKWAGARVKPWLGKFDNMDAGQNNPNSPLGSSISNDIAEIKKSVARSNAMDTKESSDIQTITDGLDDSDKKNDVMADKTEELETSLSKLYKYVRKGGLVDDIVTALNERGSKTESSEESESEEGGKQGKGKGTLGKIKSMLGKLDSGAGARTPGMGWLGKGPAIGGALGGALTAASIVALGAASGYTIYQTAKTAMAITEGKENVRNSTKGSAEAAAARNQEKYTKDNKEVQASVPRYEKAGLSKDEAVSTSIVERQNSKMLASAASMSGIFGAARHSTDFRSSEAEVTKLLEGEMLADTIRSGLDGLKNRIADPASVKKMSPEEIKSVANQAKVTLKQIGDLKKTWEESKKLGHGFLDSQWLKDETMVADGDSVINSLVESGSEIEEAFSTWEKEMAAGAKERSKKKDDKKDDKKEKPKAAPVQEKPEASTPDVEKSQRTSERRERYERLKKEGKITGDPDIDSQTMINEEKMEKMRKEAPKSTETEADDRFKALDEAQKTGVMKPPEGYRELTPEEKDRKFEAQKKLRESISSADKDTKPAIAMVGDEIKGTISEQNKGINDKLAELTEQVAKLANKKDVSAPYQYPAHPNQSFASIQTMSRGL